MGGRVSGLRERLLSRQGATRPGALGVITAVAITGAVDILRTLGLDTVQKEPRAFSSVPLRVSHRLWQRIKVPFTPPAAPTERAAGPMPCLVWADLMPLTVFFCFSFPLSSFLVFLSFQ